MLLDVSRCFWMFPKAGSLLGTAKRLAAPDAAEISENHARSDQPRRERLKLLKLYRAQSSVARKKYSVGKVDLKLVSNAPKSTDSAKLHFSFSKFRPSIERPRTRPKEQPKRKPHYFVVFCKTHHQNQCFDQFFSRFLRLRCPKPRKNIHQKRFF